MDGTARAKSFRLLGGEELEVAVQPRRGSDLEPEEMALDVVWEDEHLLVVDKPAGLVVHPGAGHRTGTLVHGLLAHEAEGGEDPERPGIVHRLDRDTSGLLVVARSDAGAPGAAGGDPQPRGDARVRRPRPRPAALARRADRGADRP